MLGDQLMCMKYLTWRLNLMDNKRATLLSAFIVFIFLILNVHLNFTVNYIVFTNETSFGNCITASAFMQSWIFVSLSRNIRNK